MTGSEEAVLILTARGGLALTNCSPLMSSLNQFSTTHRLFRPAPTLYSRTKSHLTTAPRQHVQSNACTTLLDKPKDLCGLARQIDDDPACLNLQCGTAIHDPDTG